MKPVKAKIHWIEICTYQPNGKVDEHFHEFFHAIYVMKGAGAIRIDGRPYQLQPRQFYLLAPGKKHAFWNDQAEKLITFEVKFEFSDSNFTAEMAILPECLNAGDTPVLSVLSNIRREFNGKRADSSELIALQMQEVFLYLQRCANASGQKTVHGDSEDLAEVIEYLEKNPDSGLSLQELAQIACLEKTYFLKKFKRITGLTPMIYLRNQKLKKAKDLLIYSDMNITQVSEALGFQSVHYFSRLFSKETGVSPSQYKKAHSIG